MRQLIICVAALISLSAGAHADPCAEGKLLPTEIHEHTLYLKWVGRIDPNMDAKLEAAFKEAQGRIEEVSLSLNSCGGNIGDMRAAIRVLKWIKETHRLVTVVGRGATCASACVPAFLTGHRRLGALTSIWYFHEAGSRQIDAGDARFDPMMSARWTDRVFDDYFAPAGVSKKWIARVRRLITDNDYWQTGRDLRAASSRCPSRILSRVRGNGS